MPLLLILLNDRLSVRGAGKRWECDGYRSKAKTPRGKKGLMVLTTSFIDVRTTIENSPDHSTSCFEENK